MIQLLPGQVIPGLSGERVLTSSRAAAFGVTITGTQGLRCNHCGCIWGSRQQRGGAWLECPQGCNARAIGRHSKSPARAPIGTPQRTRAGNRPPVKVR